MFDQVTRQFLTTAPSLPGLASENLVDEFTSVYVEIAAARLAMTQADAGSLDHLATVSERMGRVANVLESQVVLGIAGPRTRAAAFVAGSARQVVFQISQLLATSPGTRVDEFAISSDLAAALLFLISERTADAYEVSRLINAHGMKGIHGQIAIAISNLARGQLERIVEVRPERFEPTEIDLLDATASDLLYLRILQGVRLLAQAVLGQVEFAGVEAAANIFNEARDLAVEISPYEADFPTVLLAPSMYPGPHHLAALLENAAKTLQSASVIQIPPPKGGNANTWQDWLKTEASRYPFLWENHRRAIETGFLDNGQSLVMTSPTGSGKTTLSTLKIASTLCGGKTVVYLAPTHALVNQVEHDLNDRLGNLARAKSVEESLLEEIGQLLPDIAVLTPERCFALLTFAPELFKNVGLLVFDECHLMGVARGTVAGAASAFDRRSIDAMLCLLAFAAINRNSDYLLLSAMISNGEDLASWLPSITGRPCASFDDKWKPTRQLKAVVCYDASEISDITNRFDADIRQREPLPRSTPIAVKAIAKAKPIGLFSGGMGWHPDDPQTFALKQLIDEPISLGVALRRFPRRHWGLTANRNEVAAELAIRFQKAGLKVVIFCESIPTTLSVARRVNSALSALSPTYDDTQTQWRTKLIEEMGSHDRIYDAGMLSAAVHHGELLLEERLLVEQLFRSRTSGLNVLAATSTLAQGLNLPCEVVILAGTDRIDESDPNYIKRTDLMPHEILNALGRAGRAGLSSTGLAVVVPAENIYVDREANYVGDSQLLDTIFSASDQCAPVSDPITGLYDSIVAHGAASGEADYLLKRLALSLNSSRAGVETFDELTRRSFGYFLKSRIDPKAAEEWLGARRQKLQGLIDAADKDEKNRDWIEELAAKSGSSQKFIATLSDAYSTAPFTSPDAKEWITWLINQVPIDGNDFDNFLRPDDVERVFGRGYTSAKSETERKRRSRDAILCILPDWFSAATLSAIEEKIVAFIRAHEGVVSKPTSEDGKAKRARRFALRLVSHLSYLSGVLAQIAAKNAPLDQEPLAITQALPQLVRRGFNTPYHLYLDRQDPGRSRQAIEKQYLALESKIVRRPSDTWEEVRSKLDNAKFASLFDSESIAEFFKNPPPNTPLQLPKPPNDDDDEEM